jgi:hypothetical protein
MADQTEPSPQGDRQDDHAGAETRQDELPREQTVEMPAPTPWPMVLALAVMLVASGFVLNYAFSAAGVLLLAIALRGWIYDLLPGAGVEEVALPPPDKRVGKTRPSRRQVARERLGVSRHRLRIPEAVPPYWAGFWGGAAGGAAMAAVALFYGLVSGRGIWYPVNLLGGILLPQMAGMSAGQLARFSGVALVLGLFIHACASLAAGLLFALLLPMLPGRPLVWGGLVFPLLWTGGIYAFMGVLNPTLNAHVDWVWFVGSQFAFGLASGYVVSRFEKVKTPQTRYEESES